MTTSTSRVSTPRPSRYAKQLVEHFGRTITVDWDAQAGRGSMIFDHCERPVRGEVSLVAGEGVLLMHLECPTQEECAELERVVALRLVRLGAGDELRVQWRRGGGVEGSAWGVADLG